MWKRHLGSIILSVFLLLELGLSFNMIIQPQKPSSKKEKEVLKSQEVAILTPKIEVRNLTIKEKENYQISDFIVEMDSPKKVEYTYKEEQMGSYQEPGQYAIVLLFPSELGVISKKVTLTIEKQEEKKVEKKIVQSKSQTKVKTESLSQKILSHQGKMGTAGRLYFSNFYSVALYEADFYVDDLQKIVDEKDSAAYFLYYDYIPMIADHSIQGFDIIKKQKVGSIAYRKVKNEKGKYFLEKYQVMEKVEGTNTGTRLITKDGRDVEKTGASLVMYTCNSSNPKKVTIVLWKKIK